MQSAANPSAEKNDGFEAKGKKPQKGKPDESDQAIRDLAQCASKITDVIETQRKATEEPHDQWARLLAEKLRRLPLMKAERAKLKMDELVMDLLETYAKDEDEDI